MGACGGLPAGGRRGEVDGTNPAHGSYLTPKCLRTLQEPSAAIICSLRWSTGAGWSWPSISGRGGAEEVGERRRQKGGFNRDWKAGVDEEDGV